MTVAPSVILSLMSESIGIVQRITSTRRLFDTTMSATLPQQGLGDQPGSLPVQLKRAHKTAGWIEENSMQEASAMSNRVADGRMTKIKMPKMTSVNPSDKAQQEAIDSPCLVVQALY